MANILNLRGEGRDEEQNASLQKNLDRSDRMFRRGQVLTRVYPGAKQPPTDSPDSQNLEEKEQLEKEEQMRTKLIKANRERQQNRAEQANNATIGANGSTNADGVESNGQRSFQTLNRARLPAVASQAVGVDGAGKPEPADQLSFGTIFLMIGTAMFFDVFQAISGFIVFDFGLIGNMITFFAFMTFWFWFWTKGIKFNRPSRALTFGGATIIEFIPWVNMLPAWTLAVVIIIGTTKAKKVAGIIPGADKAVGALKK